MTTLRLKSFEKTYLNLDSELKKNFPKIFSLGELIAFNCELYRGFGVSQVHNTTSKGTKFTYTNFIDSSHKHEYKQNVLEKQSNTLGDELINEIDKYKERFL